MQRQIVISPTTEQWAVIDKLFHRATPFVASGECGHVWAEVVVDDILVRLYDVSPDGTYTFEELEDWGMGWAKNAGEF